MRLDIPHFFLSDSPVIGGDFREPFNLGPLNRDSGGSNDMSAGVGRRDNRDRPVIDLRSDEVRGADEVPVVAVQAPLMLFEQTGTRHTLVTDDGTLVRFTDNSQSHDPSTAQLGEIKIETPFFSGPDGSGGAFLRLGQEPTQAFDVLTDDNPDVPVIVGGHGLEKISAGVFGLFDPDLGEDMSLRIHGRAGVASQRPLETHELAHTIYSQTVTTLEGMIQAGLGDVSIGAGFQQEGEMTVAQLYASVREGHTNLRVEGQFVNGEFSPRLVFSSTTDGRDFPQVDPEFHSFPQLPQNAFEVFIERDN